MKGACSSKNSEMIYFVSKNMPLNCKNNLQYIFNAVCFSGHFDNALWIAKTYHVSKAIANITFCYIIQLQGDGVFSILKWLQNEYQLNIDDICANMGTIASAFINHIHVIEWFVDIFNITAFHIRQYNNKAFHNACKYGDLNVIKFLCFRFGFTISDVTNQDYHGFKAARNISMMKWLVQEFNLDLSDELKTIIFKRSFADLNEIEWVLLYIKPSRDAITSCFTNWDRFKKWTEEEVITRRFIMAHTENLIPL